MKNFRVPKLDFTEHYISIFYVGVLVQLHIQDPEPER